MGPRANRRAAGADPAGPQPGAGDTAAPPRPARAAARRRGAGPPGAGPPGAGPLPTAPQGAAPLPADAYRRLFERSPEPHFVERLDGTIVDVNDAAARLHGWTREELIGQSYRVTLSDEPKGIGDDAIHELLDRGAFRRQATALRRDGSTFPTEVVAIRLPAAGGDLALIHVTDLSHRLALEAAGHRLGELGRLGDQPLAPDAVAAEATQIVVESFGATSGALITFEGDRLHWRAAIGPVPRAALADSVPSRSRFLRRVQSARRAEAVDLSASDLRPSTVRALRGAGVGSAWLLPVLSGDEHQGVIAVVFDAPPPANAFDAERLSAIGRVVGTALHNAYLRDAMREELERRGRLEESARLADVVVRQVQDPVIVVDPSLRITSWNAAAERVYGVEAATAVGRTLTDVFVSADADGTVVAMEKLRDVLRGRPWRARAVQHPLIGTRVGEEIIVDAVVTALHDEHGRPAGVVAINRDVTATARLEAQLAALGSLAAETGRARSQSEVADAALAILGRGMNAAAGVILTIDGDRFEVTAHTGVSDATAEMVAGIGRLGERLGRALRDSAAVVVVPVADSPLLPEVAAALQSEGIATIMFVGLRVGGELQGLLGLGWHEAPATRPSDEAVLQAAALVASGIANARLLGRIERGFDQERRLATRLETLIDLTRLPAVADDERTLAEELLDRITVALGAGGGHVVRLVEGRLERIAGPPPSAEPELVEPDSDPAEWRFVRRFLAGEPAFVDAIDRRSVTRVSYRTSQASGYHAYGAFPLRDGDRLEGALLVFFRQRVGDLPVDDRTMEAIGRIVQIAFINQRLRRTAIASEERYRTLFEESPDALMVQSEDLRIVDVNRAAERVYRATRDQLVGRDVYDFVVSERRTDSASRSETWRAVGRRADGQTFPQEVIVSRIEIDGQPRILAQIRDLTAQEQLQQELVQAQKMEAIGQLVSGVAHELNNPLAAIVAFSQLIRKDPQLPDDLRRDADLLVGEADRTRRIVQNLLDFARQRPPERHPTSLRRLVDSVLELQTYALDVNQIETAVDIPASVPPVELDRAQMQQVLLNLVQNAIHAIRSTGGPGRITISARWLDAPEGPRVRITVTDTGPGVDPRHRDVLFDPFFTTKAPGEGTGLGLPVSFGIVAGHGGHLAFEPEDAGATFAITLPVVSSAEGGAPGEDGFGWDEPPAARDRASATVAAALPRRRVLVLDDEPAIRAFLKKALPAAGFDADVTGDGGEAVLLARQHDYAAVLCDYRMAGMSGTDVFDALVALRPELADRFVFMSGDVLNPELAAFATGHRVALLAKPFDLDAVHRLVRTIAERSGTARTDAGAGTEYAMARDRSAPTRQPRG